MSVIEWIFSSAGLLGSIASLVGVVMAYRQSTAAKEAAEHTRTVAEEARRAADATHAEVTRTLSAMNMAKFASIIHEIRGYLGYEKLELANLRMRELKDVLIELHEIPGLMDEGIRDRLSVYQQTLGSDIIGVERQIDRVRRYASAKANGSDGEMAGVPILDVMMIIGHLEELSEFLVENEAKLKYARNS